MSHYKLEDNLPFYTSREEFKAIKNPKILICDEEKNWFTTFRISWSSEGPHTLCLRGEATPFTFNKPFYTDPFPFYH